MRGSLAGRAGRAATVAVTLCWMLAALLAPGTRAALAQGATGIPGLQTESTAQVEFGAEIRFQLQAQSDEPITSVLFLYQVDDSPVQNTGVPSYRPGTSVDAIYSWRVANVLVPGTEIRYRWQVETASGRRATTKEQLVAYDDTRFNWQTVKGDLVTVYYPSSDPQAGQALLEEAGKAQGRLRREYGLSLDKPLRIFAYTGREEYASALYTGRPLDVATTVGTDRIFVLAPGGTSGMTVALQGLRRELATALFLQKTRNPYA
ncbi:MAG: hypothetical protein ACRDI2_05595, partial [Chloroflexota bacterium]